MLSLIKRTLSKLKDGHKSKPISLLEIIKTQSHPMYDAHEFNDAFCEMIKTGMALNASFLYDAFIFNKFRRPLTQYYNKTPETIIQIGPGGSLGCEVLFSLTGIKNVCSLDPYPLPYFDLDNFFQFLQKSIEMIKLFEGINKFDTAPLKIPESETLGNDKYRIGKNTIHHLTNRMFENTGFEDESVDFLFSNAVLEHVRNPLESISETRRILKKGGITSHQIDLRDHRDFNRPLKFLNESETSWEHIMNQYCANDPSIYMNRWRASQFLYAFNEEGFTILEFIPNMTATEEMIASEIPFLNEHFKKCSQDDLSTLSVFFVAQKVS